MARQIGILALLAITGCASHPKMQIGAPLEIGRGYWLDWTRFHQNGHQVDRGDVKDKLNAIDASAGDVGAAQAFEIGASIAAVASGILIGTGIARELNGDKSWPLFLAGGGGLGLSIAFGFAAESNYVDAVNHYNKTVSGDGWSGRVALDRNRVSRTRDGAPDGERESAPGRRHQSRDEIGAATQK